MAQRQIEIVNVLQRVVNRYNALLLSKLILYEKEKLCDVQVRHYDTDCEAAITLAGTLQTKVKAVQLKCFSILKDHALTDRSSSNSVSFNNAKSFHNDHESTFHSPRGSQNAYELRSNKTSNDYSKFYMKDIIGRKYNMTKQTRDLDCSVQALLQKVSHFTSKFQKRRELQDVGHKENSETTMKRVAKNSIMQKRKNIMYKLSKLEHDLNYLANDKLCESKAKQKSSNYSLSSSRMQGHHFNEGKVQPQRIANNEVKSYSIRWTRE